MLYVIPPVLSLDGHEPPWSSQEETKEAELQQLLGAYSEPVQEGPVASTASDKEHTGGFQREATEKELQQPLTVVSELVQESLVTSIASDEALTKLEAKLQEQYTLPMRRLIFENRA